ncbi:diguanylate cyclase/phosphodiesterase with GAF sensor (plasmid) [Allomeiothermus silvanus DSM 9946]|uniref:Diguanylate cyclase/phosphodiesterase with GAF sensor n=2 Tax=Allomeiothermus silvanus TaxID=52022 RepID=D7BJK5_ALLS1|nr:diguanylate cyclase/phosphodiesterase with GAF sensor [Allomeiothermus silvanus DSM 9946]
MLPLWEGFSTVPEERLFQGLLEAAVSVVPGAEAGSITLLLEGRFRFVATVGYDREALQRVSFAPEEQWGFCRRGLSRVRQVGRPEIEAQRSAYDAARGSLLEVAGRMGEIRSVLVAPVFHDGMEIAYLHLDSFSQEAFPSVAYELIEAFAHQLGLLVSRRRWQEALRWQARHDPLTQLLNRHGFEEAVAAFQGPGHSLMVIELEELRRINQRYGRPRADQALQHMAGVMASSLPVSSFLSRWEGGTFVLVLPSEEAPRYLEGLRQQLPYAWRAGTAGLEGDWEAALAHADFALRYAKSHRRDSARFEDLRALYERQRVLLAELEQALASLSAPALRLEFQPVVAFPDAQQVLFLEALLRFAEAPPLEVLALAEQHGLLSALTERILDLALSEAARRGQPVSVNLSPAQLHPLLPEAVARTLARHGLPASSLVLEIVEAAFHEDCLGLIQHLREMGMAIWLDDFGSGHSNFERLLCLPIDGIKLSHSFARHFTSPRGRYLAEGLVTIARGLKLPVVVEGIEEPEQVKAFYSMGFSWGQGFLYRPFPSRSAS